MKKKNRLQSKKAATPSAFVGTTVAAQVIPRNIVDEMQESYLDYAMSVIVSRALPDVRDGLKPVHRRILYAMWDMGLKAGAKFRKSATIIGECLGKYHPHGDISVYDALVRMAQDFSMRSPLVHGQGNFGSVDGDSAAAYRYCVTGDTLVVTQNGLVPIQSIADSVDEKQIHLKILSRDQKISFASRWFNSGEHPTLTIRTRHGYELRGSYNHPILTWQQSFFGGEFVWKKLDEISVGDTVVMDRSADSLWPEHELDAQQYHPESRTKRRATVLPKKITSDLAFILGALVSEGFIGKTRLEFCNSDRKFIEEFQMRWKRTFPDSVLHIFERLASSWGKKPYVRVECHYLHTLAFLDAIGLQSNKSNKKRIPYVILRSPKHVTAEFLKAYYEGDGGTIQGKKRFDLFACSVSPELMKDLQILLLRFGIMSSRRYDHARALHQLFIRGQKNLTLFADDIGFLSERKKGKLLTYLSLEKKEISVTDYIPFLASGIRQILPHSGFIKKNNFDRFPMLEKNGARISTIVLKETGAHMQPIFSYLLDTHYLFEKIECIEKGEPVPVYSIRVDSACHSFVANGFINHNTEAKLSKIAEELLYDIDKETVPFIANYDGTHKEPTLLPAKLPNLLLNGTSGIAVGMATNIPPHNLGELCDAIIHLIQDPEADVDDLMEYVKGPDFPTGGIMYDIKALKQAYTTGRGGIVVRARTEIVEAKNGAFQILVTEIPYQVNKSNVLEKIAELVQTKKIEGIRDLRDESNKEGIRVVIELKKDTYPKKILNQLFKSTQLQDTFHFNMVALVDGIQPRTLTLKAVLEEFIKHRRIVVVKRAEYDLAKARDRAHILEGLKIALDAIDAVIKTIKQSRDRDEAKGNLMKKFKLSERQTIAILEMRLAQLANLERLKIEQELKEKRALIRELEALLASPKRILGVVKEETEEIRTTYHNERRTQVVKGGIDKFQQEDLIPNESTLVVITRDGYIKRLPSDTFRIQERGGKGVLGLTTKEEDTVDHLFSCMTHNDLLFFTTRGRVFQLKAYDVPLASRTAKGQAIVNFLQLSANEKVTAILSLAELTKNKYKYLMAVTKHGLTKKTDIEDFKSVRRSGLIAITLRDDDMLEWVRPTTGADEILMVTAQGQAIRFKESDVRAMGRTAAGVRAIRLKRDDVVVGMDIITGSSKDAHVLTVMEKGFGKRSTLKAYKVQGRGGSGIKTAKITAKTGAIVMARIVDPNNLPEGVKGDLLIISEKGQVIRISVKSVSITGRATQGVRLMRSKESADKVASVTMI